MALPGPEGNRRRSLFPRLFPKAFTRAFTRFFSRLLRGLRERTTSGRQTARDQLLSSDLIFLSNASNGLSLGVGPSALQERVDLLLELLDRGLALDLLAIDKEGRRRIDLQHLAGILLVGGDLVEQRLIFQ